MTNCARFHAAPSIRGYGGTSKPFPTKTSLPHGGRYKLVFVGNSPHIVPSTRIERDYRLTHACKSRERFQTVPYTNNNLIFSRMAGT
jgi:hypothetical protein